MTEDERGQCRSCGAKLVDWKRIHRRELSDARFTFEALQYEMIRHHYWHVPIDQRAENHARRKGRIRLKEAIRKRILQSVGPAMHARDGRQTPLEGSGNVIYYAQHAVACCCRTCMEYWHGIPKGVALTEGQVGYFSELVMMYVDARMPYLKDDPEKIPFIRNMAQDRNVSEDRQYITD